MRLLIESNAGLFDNLIISRVNAPLKRFAIAVSRFFSVKEKYTTTEKDVPVMKNESKPAAIRHDVLDALRGFALFGIFFANVPFFAGWLFVDGDTKSTIAGGGFYDAFMLLFIDGRFYTIFSFLFGLGFALQLSRLQAKESNKANKIYLRRIFILLVIGLLHLFVFWIGDILTLYAVLGFVLFFFRNVSDAKLLIMSASLFLLPIVGYWLFWTLDIDPSLGIYAWVGKIVSGKPGLQGFFSGFYEVVHTTSIGRYFELNVQIGAARIGYNFDTWRIPKVLAIMLLGMWAGRALVAGKLLENKVLLKRITLFGLLIGLPSSVAYAKLSGLNSFQPYSMEGYISVIMYTLAVFPLAFAYIALFFQIWNSNSALLRVFAPAGRMALTNYLLQTVLGITIFYGIGFGLGIEYGPASFVVIAITVFALQVALSHLWFKFFRFGIFEWIWRILTYGKFFDIMK